MREGIRNHASGGLTLQRVVADLGCGPQGAVDVAGFDEARAFFLLAVDPDAGETIRLQLNPDLQGVGGGLAAGRLLLRCHLRQNAQKVLNVMARFMGDDVGGGELAGRALAAVKAGLDLAEKSGVEENLPVRRTVERTHRRLRHAAAAAIGGVAEQHDTRAGVGLPRGLEDLAPAVVDLAENAGNHAAHFVGRRAALDGAGSPVGLVGRRLATSAQDLRAADQDPRVDAKRIADQAEHDIGSDAKPAPADRKPDTAAPHSATAIVATVLDVVAAAKIIVTHGPISSLNSAAEPAAPSRRHLRGDGRIFSVWLINPLGKNCLVLVNLKFQGERAATLGQRIPNLKSP